jgi:hypothetical protein
MASDGCCASRHVKDDTALLIHSAWLRRKLPSCLAIESRDAPSTVLRGDQTQRSFLCEEGIRDREAVSLAYHRWLRRLVDLTHAPSVLPRGLMAWRRISPLSDVACLATTAPQTQAVRPVEVGLALPALVWPRERTPFDSGLSASHDPTIFS